MVNATAAELDKVWDEVGFSPEEREKQLNDLLGRVGRSPARERSHTHTRLHTRTRARAHPIDEVKRLCDEKVDDEREVRSAYMQVW